MDDDGAIAMIDTDADADNAARRHGGGAGGEEGINAPRRSGGKREEGVTGSSDGWARHRPFSSCSASDHGQ